MSKQKNLEIIFLLSFTILTACAVSRTQTVNSPNGIVLDEKKESPENVFLKIPYAELQRAKNDNNYADKISQQLIYQFMYVLGVVNDQGRLPYLESFPGLQKKLKDDLMGLSNLRPDNLGYVNATYHTYQKTIRHYMISSTANLLTMTPAQALDTQLEYGLQGLLKWGHFEELSGTSK